LAGKKPEKHPTKKEKINPKAKMPGVKEALK
jgi:hypothetical protein